jgi:predicted ArsR family transcriptional regulator
MEYAGERGELEAPFGEFVCDAVSGAGTVIEVQTGSFGPLVKKLKWLCAEREVLVIYPVIVVKHIEVYETDGALRYRRKSPRKGTEWDVFDVLIHAVELTGLSRLSICLALVDVVEKRVADGKGSWRRKGVSIQDKILRARRDNVLLSRKKDYLRFVPFAQHDEWTARELAEKVKIPVTLAQKTVYVLAKMGIVVQTGKKGRARLYKIAENAVFPA